MSVKRKQVDMLNGSLIDKIVLFALPLAASSVLQQLFNAADLAVVGRFASSTAMAAVGSNSSLISLLLSLFMGLSLGSNVLIATYIGRGHKEEINAAVHSTIAIALVCGMIVLLLGLLLARPLLLLMNAPKDVIDLAALYLRIYFFAVPFIMIYNFGSAILRSKGDSKRPLIAMTISGILNVGLNLLLVIVFHLHVIGVAVATVASNVLSAALVLYFLMHEEEDFRLSLKKIRVRKEDLSMTLRVGLPAGLQGMVFSLSNVVIQSSVNSFGSLAVAGNTAAQNFDFIDFCMINAFVQAGVTFTSQNFAAKKFDRCRKVFRIVFGLGIGCGVVICSLIFLLRNHMILLFTKDPAVIEYAMIRILCTGAPHFLIGTYEIPGGCLRGMGKSIIPMIISIVGTCAFRLIWVFTVVSTHHEFSTLCLVYPISWLLTGIVMMSAYLFTRKKLFTELSAEQT